jgi:C4-dicarboxylate-specific signal transduction histidine kinase
MNSQDKLQELVLNGDFEAISKIFEKNEKRLDKILRQSDNQQASILKLNAELEDYKNNLEIKVVEETSKRVEQEKLLMQSSKMAEMGSMLGAIIHQWKQPITIINMLTDIISQDIKTNNLDLTTLEKDIGTIKHRVLLLSSTIDDFKNFFKPDKEIKEFVVKDLIQNVLRVIEHQILKYSATIQIDENSTVTLFGFENELKHVILNIINNALEACNEKSAKTGLQPNIKIDIRENEKDSIIEIADNGGGIPPHIMEKLFTPYTTSKGEDGTGIGLTLAKTIIEDHHKGELKAHNNEFGAVFTITIPKKGDIKC